MNYHVKRVAQAIFTLFAVITLSFVMYRLMPGGPIQAMQLKLLQQTGAQTVSGANMERINDLVQIYTGIDPDTPIHIAYYNYVRDILLYQDFGQSIWYNEPVFTLLFKAMPWSIFVSVYGITISYAMTIVFGAAMAYAEGSRFDSVMTTVIIVLHSIPYYVGAILMLSFLAFQLGWFPTGGRMTDGTVPGLNYPFMAGVVHHGALPILTSLILGFGGAALSMRGNSIRVMGENYLRVARLRGLHPNRIATQYVARNAILPMYTSFMIGLGSLFGSSIIMEQIFTYPGVGWFTFQALQSRDYPLLMGAFIFFTTITLTGVLIADFTYGWLDPRAAAGDEEVY